MDIPVHNNLFSEEIGGVPKGVYLNGSDSRLKDSICCWVVLGGVPPMLAYFLSDSV